MLKDRQDEINEGRATATMVRFCFDYLKQHRRLTPETMDALCRLTWISKYRGDVTEAFIRTTKTPALKTIFGLRGDGESPADILPAIATILGMSRHNVGRVLGTPTGMVNLYTAYRRQVLPWLRRHKKKVRHILERAYALSSDADAYGIAAEIAGLPGIPLKGRRLGPEQLLTPLIACLDPRRRFPILNAGYNIKRLLAKARLSRRSLTDRFDGVTGMIGPGLCKDAFELDSMGADVLLLDVSAPTITRRRKPSSQKELSLRDEQDIETLLSSKRKLIRVEHNRMTNAILRAYRGKKLVKEGTGDINRFDVLIENYNNKGNDLLVEVKSSVDLASARLAVGQLLDYRRFLRRRLATDLAVLFLVKPSKHIGDFLLDVGVRPLWFASKTMKVVVGI